MRWCGLYALLLACTVGAQPQPTVQPMGDFAQTEGVRGQLIPQQKTTLAAGMGGKLSRVTATIGQRVKRGQRLVVFDCGVLQARQSIAQASVRASQARFESNQALLSLNSVGPLEVNLSAAELAMAKGELQVIERELDQCEIVAPFSGVVVERFVEPHQYVPTGEALLSLVSNSSLEVRLLAPSVWLNWLRPGVEFRFSVDEIAETFSGKVTRLGGQVDAISQSITLYGELTQPSKALLSGMSGQVFFDSTEAP